MRGWLIGIVAIVAAAAVPAVAAERQVLSPGTYILEGGSYSVQVSEKDGGLVVIESNKSSTYKLAEDGSYQYTNPTNNITYGLRVIDDHTIEAFKPRVEGNVPTRLVRLGGAPNGGPPPAAEQAERWSELASQYSAKVSGDPANTQSWTACAAVAMKRSVSSEAEADAYAQQVAGMLKQMDATASPCPEVIRSSNW